MEEGLPVPADEKQPRTKDDDEEDWERVLNTNSRLNLRARKVMVYFLKGVEVPIPAIEILGLMSCPRNTRYTLVSRGNLL